MKKIIDGEIKGIKYDCIGSAPTIWAYKNTIKDFTVDPQDVLIYVGGGLNYAWLDK